MRGLSAVDALRCVLSGLNHQPAAFRAGLRDRPFPLNKITIRIVFTAVEGLPAAAVFGEDLSAAFRAFDSGGFLDLLGVTAGRESAA